jgi:hypothetical protein
VLDEFFASSRLRDTTALRRIATVVFEPLRPGIVVECTIRETREDTPDRRTVVVQAPVRMPDGTVAPRTLIATLERGVLHDDAESARRWIVTGMHQE